MNHYLATQAIDPWKRGQVNSKSSVTIISRCYETKKWTFMIFESMKMCGYHTVLQGNSNKGAAVHSAAPSKNWTKYCWKPYQCNININAKDIVKWEKEVFRRTTEILEKPGK